MKLKESLTMIVIGLVVGSILTLAVLNLQQALIKPQPSMPRIEEFKREYSRKRWMGYDVFRAYEYYVRALDAYKRGERDEAVEIFKQAIEALERPSLSQASRREAGR